MNTFVPYHLKLKVKGKADQLKDSFFLHPSYPTELEKTGYSNIIVGMIASGYYVATGNPNYYVSIRDTWDAPVQAFNCLGRSKTFPMPDGWRGVPRFTVYTAMGKMTSDITPTEVLPAEVLLPLAIDMFKRRNGFVSDTPTLEELMQPPEMAAALVELEAELQSTIPLPVKITYFRRRHLLYISDGRIAPFSEGFIDGSPLLYNGFAWATRFLVDGKDHLNGMCIAYLNDELKFICTDWCQRDRSPSMDDNNINLYAGTNPKTLSQWIAVDLASKVYRDTKRWLFGEPVGAGPRIEVKISPLPEIDVNAPWPEGDKMMGVCQKCGGVHEYCIRHQMVHCVTDYHLGPRLEQLAKEIEEAVTKGTPYLGTQEGDVGPATKPPPKVQKAKKKVKPADDTIPF